MAEHHHSSDVAATEHFQLPPTTPFVPQDDNVPSALDQAFQAPAAPQLGNSRYQGFSYVNKGTFGWVYRAMDTLLGREVAIKLAKRTATGLTDRDLEEARTQAALDHPHVLPVYDVGLSEDHRVYVVSKYVSGKDLAHRLQAGPLPPAEAAELTACIADALDHAHQCGRIHLDVKPANILLDARGSPYLADFGLSTVLRGADTAALGGTPRYMSPEQCARQWPQTAKDQSLVDGRSDIFSLGIVLYELLTGRPPFAGSTIAVLAAILLEPPPDLPPHLPSQVRQVCLRALEKEPEQRYRTAGEMAAALRWHQGPVSETAPPSDPAATAVAQMPVPLQFQLRVLSGPEQGAVFPLDKSRITLGRSRDCHIILTDKRVSRFQCYLTWDKDQKLYAVNDPGSAGPVQVNGAPLRGWALLPPGTVLGVGKTELVLEYSVPPEVLHSQPTKPQPDGG